MKNYNIIHREKSKFIPFLCKKKNFCKKKIMRNLTISKSPEKYVRYVKYPVPPSTEKSTSYDMGAEGNRTK